jgi:hypothetical protein
MVSCPIFLCSCSSAFLIQNHQLCWANTSST